MKRVFYCVCAITLILISWASAVFAGFTLPGEVYRIGSLRDVEKKARSMNAPIVFVYSDENSSCGLAREATLDVVRELKGKALIVYVARNDSGIPGNVIKAMNSPAAGKFIPKTVAVNPRTGKVETIIPYISNRDQRISEIRKIGALKF